MGERERLQAARPRQAEMSDVQMDDNRRDETVKLTSLAHLTGTADMQMG
jgi:hypothetical protein